MDDNYNSSESVAISERIMSMTGSKNGRHYSLETLVTDAKLFMKRVGSIKNCEPPYPVPMQLDMVSPEDSIDFPPLCDGTKILGCFYKESDDYCISQFLKDCGLDLEALSRLSYGYDMSNNMIIFGDSVYILNPRYMYHNEYFGNLRYRYLSDVYYHIKITRNNL